MVLEAAAAITALVNGLSMTAVGSLIVVPAVFSVDACVASMRAESAERHRQERRGVRGRGVVGSEPLESLECDDTNDEV